MRYTSILETIGKTPLVRINRLTTINDAAIYAKTESFNPCRCVKDRSKGSYHL